MCFAVNLGVAVELELTIANLRFAAEMCLAANLGVVAKVELAAANLQFATETKFPAAN